MIKRQSDIVIYLNTLDTAIAAKKLAEYFSVTTRTLRSDIKKINSIIEKHGVSITSNRNQGYRLVIKDQYAFSLFWQDLIQSQQTSVNLETTEERIKHLLIILLYSNDYISLDDLADEVHVSISTVLTYLKSIRDYLSEFHLILKNKVNFGYIVDGEEINKRQCILKTIESNVVNTPTTFNLDQRHLFSYETLLDIEQIVLSTSDINIEFSDYDLKNLILHIALSISRIENYQTISNFQLPKFDVEIEKSLSNMLERIEKAFDVVIPKGERNYIYSRFFINSRTIMDGIDIHFINKVIEDTLSIIKQKFGHDLTEDKLLIQDLQKHFEAIMTLKYFDLTKKNPLLNTIKSNYPYEFEVTLIALNKTLQGFPELLTEDEIAYIALHIGAALQRSKKIEDQTTRIILISGSGHATSRILESELAHHFKDDINIIERVTYSEFARLKDVDAHLILSTLHINKEIDLPIINVTIPLKDESIAQIKKFINYKNYESQLNKYFDDTFFHRFDKNVSKEDALLEMSQIMEQYAIVNEQYYDSVLEREKLLSTLMDHKIAIPHPLNTNAYQTKISVAIFDEPILWNQDESAQILFLLAISKDDKQKLEDIYTLLVNLINNEKKHKNLINAQKMDDVKQILLDKKEL